MNVSGTEIIRDEMEKPGFFFKAILNDFGAVFFRGKTEHRTVKHAGLSYEDEYKGNAMAAVITNGRIEIRTHKGFTPEKVARIMAALLEHPELRDLADFPVRYGGKTLE